MKIAFTQGALAGAEFPLDRPSVTLGRGADVDLQVLDSSVSRRHAQLTVSGDVVTITDLGSHNGTYVNGIRIRHAQVLEPDDEITLGASAFTLSAGLAQSAWPSQSEASPVDWAPPVPNRRKRSFLLPIAAFAVIGTLAGAGAFFALRHAGPAPTPTAVALLGATVTTESTPPSTPTAPAAPTDTAAPTATTAPETVAPTLAVAATPAPTSTRLVAPLAITVTIPPLVATTATVRPTSTVAVTPAPRPPTTAPTVAVPPYTVSWSPGTYDPWEGGHRLRTDLTITNVSLPQMPPPYEPSFIIVAPDGSMRAGDIHDYSSPTNPLPTLLPGQSVTWTWYTIMPVQDWVRGSAFRYGDLTWTQEFAQDGSLAGAPRATSDAVFAPLIPTVFPSGVSPELLATVLPTIMPTFLPSGATSHGQ